MIKIYVPKMCVTKLAVPPDDKKKRTRILADGTNVYDEKKKIVIFFFSSYVSSALSSYHFVFWYNHFVILVRTKGVYFGKYTVLT